MRACVGRKVRKLAESVLRNPVFLTVGTGNAGATEIGQRLVYVGKEEGKLLAVRQLVQDGFCVLRFSLFVVKRPREGKKHRRVLVGLPVGRISCKFKAPSQCLRDDPIYIYKLLAFPTRFCLFDGLWKAWEQKHLRKIPPKPGRHQCRILERSPPSCYKLHASHVSGALFCAFNLNSGHDCVDI